MPFQTHNPTTGDLLQSYPSCPLAQAEQKMDAAAKAFLVWREFDIKKRASFLQKLATLLEQSLDKLAKQATCEMGKPLLEARGEVKKCVWLCHHFAENAATYLEPEGVSTEANENFVTWEPLGPIFAIMPWNFPYWQILRFAVPALMAGNTIVIKPSPETIGCALLLAEIFNEAKFPQHVFQTCLSTNETTAAIIQHPQLAGVTFTGSTRTGRIIASIAGSALKKTVLELGGSDPYLILEDANLEAAAIACVQSRLISSGQCCAAAKRLIAVKSILKEFEQLIVEQMKKMTMGDPLSPETIIGPMARADLRDQIHQQVCESIQAGAKLLLGGEIPDRAGNFYPPTVLTNVQQGMPTATEEVFGPVASILPAKNTDDAIRIANDSTFGLGGGVFTRDVHRGREIATKCLDVGTVCVNDFVRTDPRLPFGGIKQSGYGRELGRGGIREFTNPKTVSVIA